VAWFVAWLLAHRLSLWFWDITIIKQRARARFQLWLFLFLDSSLLVIYALQVSLSVEARSNDGHADFIAQVVIDDGTEDEVDVFVSLFLNHDRCLVNFLQTQIGTTGNGKQNALGAFHAGFQQWRINSLFCRLHHAVITACRAYAHQRRTSIRHNRAHVGTTPTVKDHCRLAMDATTGAGPVPVPPPSPAVTTAGSAPASASSISDLWSSAEVHPTSGFAPAPSPRISTRPMSSFTSASEKSRAWESVLIAMN